MTNIAYDTNVKVALNKLIDSKSARDNKRFTPFQLAKALGVNRSLISKLLTGHIVSPRLDTLLKIVHFFQADGFDISLDQLAGAESKYINIEEQILPEMTSTSLPLFQMNDLSSRIGTTELNIPHSNPDTIAVFTTEDIPPIFKSGSIFVVDTTIQEEHGNIVIAKSLETGQISINKYRRINNTPQLSPLDKIETNIEFSKNHYRILGVVIHIQAKT